MKFSKNKYIFIVGNSRSGTTMLASILGKSSDTLVFKELHYFDLISTPRIVIYSVEKAIEVYAKLLCVNKLEPWNLHRYKEFLTESEKQLCIKIKINNFELLDIFISNQLELNNKKVAVEQTPRNSNFLKLISENIPESKFIHIIRDPRDILLSQKNKWKRNKFGGNMSRKEVFRTYINHNPFITSLIYKKTLKSVANQKADIPSNRFIEVKFEDILEKPIISIEQLFNFLELNFNKSVLTINHTSSSYVSNKEKGIDSTRKFSWKGKISNTEQAICQSINKENIIRNKYELIKKNPNFFVLFFYFIALIFQFFFIVIFNLKILIKHLK
jgi:omega-hydroxy-beta-dihydromenaquinone-9 sulfotransferase